MTDRKAGSESDPGQVAVVKAALGEAVAAVTALERNQAAVAAIAAAGRLMAGSLRAGGHVYACGNGGSMCDAMHFAEELSGKFRAERRPLPAAAISDPAHLTCAANDFGYDSVFARYLLAHGRPGDVLLAISTSGKSPNVLLGAQAARDRGMRVVSLTGGAGSPLGTLADLDIPAAGGTRYSDRVQELHIKIIHTLIELVERDLFPELYR